MAYMGMLGRIIPGADINGIYLMKSTLLFLILSFMSLSFSCSAEENILYFYNWYDYIPEKIVEQFSQETGIKVISSYYDSNEEMFDTLSITNGNGYDLVVPSGYFVSMMVADNLLRKIDVSKLQNYRNLDKLRLGVNPQYSIPYCWGATVLLIDSEVVDPEKVKSWGDLLRPEFGGKTLIVCDLRDVFSIALSVLGYSINTRKQAEIAEAYNWLKVLKPQVKFVSSENIVDLVTENRPALAVLYNGDALSVQHDLPAYTVVFPQEGVPLWIDCFVIPKGAKHVDNAYKFIDFILRSDISKIIVEEIFYSTPSKTVLELLDESLRENRVLVLKEEDIGDSEFIDYVGKAFAIYERYWKMLNQE